MAKKKTPAELKAEGVELGKLIATARKRDHNFAMLIGKDGLVLCADPKKPAAAMRRLAKSEGGGAKGAQGIMRIQGKVIEFHCEEESPPKMLRKMAKKHMNERGQQFKVMIMTPAGEVEDDDDEDDVADEKSTARAPDPEVEPAPEPVAEASPVEETPAPAAPAAPEVPAGPSDDAMAELREKLMAEFAALESDIEAAKSSGDKVVSKKTPKLAQMFLIEVEKDPRKADKVLTLLKQTLAAAAPQTRDGGASPATQVPPADTSETQQSTEAPVSMMPPISVDLSECPASEEDAISQMVSTFGAFWDQVCAPSEGDQAIQAERDKIAQQRERMGQAFHEALTGSGDMAAVAAEYVRLNTMVTTAQQIEALGAANPQAATEARQAMATFDAELGEGTPVTPELLQALTDEQKIAETRMKEAQTQLKVVQSMPDGPDKDAAMRTLQAELDIVGPMLEAAQNKLRAAKGKQQLAEAITVGPLAPDAPRPMSDGSVAQLIEAFTRAPDLATFAAETAGSSQNPDAIASGIGTLCDNVEAGFVDGEGNAPPADFKSEDYAQHLIAGAGNEGGAYLQEASEYIAGGGHLEADPIPSPSGDDTNGRSRDRTHFMASSVLGEGGNIDVASPAAQEALGHLRFSPDVIDNPVPEVNSRVQDMYAMLADSDNQATAEGILGDVDTPTGAGAMLVGRSAGSGMSIQNPDADDARRSVMISMMTPVHQGAVGSCFATSGVRRMSEQDPLEAMERYAELAETGQFQPRNGMDAIPAVTSFPDDEDPLIRSLEYSTATAMAGMEGNSRNVLMQNAIENSVDGLAEAVSGGNAFERIFIEDDWDLDQEVIRTTLMRSFAVEYDSVSPSAEVASDGRSSTGGYFLVQVIPTRRVINDKTAFIEALTERVLTCLAIDPKGDQGIEVANVIKSNDFLSELEAGKSAPWNLGSGGVTSQAEEVLFGEATGRDTFIEEPGIWDSGDTRGERTSAVLESMLTQFADSDAEMLPIDTSGIHSFHALPNHPSLAPLQEGGDFEANIEALVAEPGREIATTALPESRVIDIFASFMTRLRAFDPHNARKALIDTAERTGLGSGEKKPSEIASGIVALVSAYLDKLAEDQTRSWQRQQIAAGEIISEAQRDRKEAEYRTSFGNAIKDMADGALAGGTPVPVFTIADTNWGDGEHTVNFVVAPDPSTGEPRLWTQNLPSGDLTPAGDKWANAAWVENELAE